MCQDITLGEISRLGIECGDCGRSRWNRPDELKRYGIQLTATIAEVAPKLTCKACRSDGLPGKNVSVQVYFNRDFDRNTAEAAVLRNQSILSAGSRARRA